MRDPEKFGGVRGLTKDARKALSSRQLTVACGKCMECRLAAAHEWALRAMHEASLYMNNIFVTLTYDDEHLPSDWSLHYPDFQKFMHRLRKRQPGAGRFLMCAEYGEQFGRPHYHAILFNCAFSDKMLVRDTPKGPLYTSEKLSDIWGLGHVSFGDVTLDSAGYVARYTTKKITGPAAGAAYQFLIPGTDVVVDRPPPFLRSSLQPGIGAPWLEKYLEDVFPSDFLVMDGKRFPVPRYYSKLFERWEPDEFARIKELRRVKARAMDSHPDNSSRRLRDRNEVGLLKAKAFRRDLL